jgi:hypothetical protein
MVEDLAPRDGEEPGGEAGPERIEGGRAPGDRDPGLLVQIFGGVAVRGAQEPADELEARAIIPVIKPCEGVRIAGAVGVQQVSVVRVVRLHQGQA